MFSIQPYDAQRQSYVSQPDGGMKSEWSDCRVIGITNDEDGEPAYLVEVRSGREFVLAVEPYIRKCQPSA